MDLLLHWLCRVMEGEPKGWPEAPAGLGEKENNRGEDQESGGNEYGICVGRSTDGTPLSTRSEGGA